MLQFLRMVRKHGPQWSKKNGRDVEWNTWATKIVHFQNRWKGRTSKGAITMFLWGFIYKTNNKCNVLYDGFTCRWFNIAMENGPLMDDELLKNGDYHSYVKLPDGNAIFYCNRDLTYDICDRIYKEKYDILVYLKVGYTPKMAI